MNIGGQATTRFNKVLTGRENLNTNILEVESFAFAAAAGFWTNSAGTLKTSGTFHFSNAVIRFFGWGTGGAISALQLA